MTDKNVCKSNDDDIRMNRPVTLNNKDKIILLNTHTIHEVYRDRRETSASPPPIDYCEKINPEINMCNIQFSLAH